MTDSAERYPKIRLDNGEGFLELREGLIISFYMHRSHREVGPAVSRALEAYCRAIRPQSLQLYPEPRLDGDWLRLDEAAWARIHQHLHNTAHDAAYRISLLRSFEEGGAYYFSYVGRNLDSPELPGGGKSMTGVFFQLPTEYLEEHGPARVRSLALELGSELPFNFGYASLAYLSDGGFSRRALHKMRELCFRYPGLDMAGFGGTVDLGTQARGAYWLTFLGQPLLGQLGGPERLRQQLPPEISLEPLTGERLLLTLGEWPEAGDTERGETLPRYRKLARVLEPFLYQADKWPSVAFSPEERLRWTRRFLD